MLFLGCVQEVEEDKKMAEEDVVSPPGRKGKADDLSITISKSASVSVCALCGPDDVILPIDLPHIVPVGGSTSNAVPRE